MIEEPLQTGRSAMPTPVLEIEQVTVGAVETYDSSVSEIALSIEAGALAMVLLEAEHTHLPLADLAVGILAPDAGCVRFLGTDWLDMTPTAAADTRGRVGRVFEGNPWIESMEVSQNIMLAQLHHTRRTMADLTRQAEELSRAFGLPGLPLHSPSTVQGKDLARAACVRAFMGQPDLLILERPTAGVYPEILPVLLNMLRSARSRGAAVLWLTDNPDVWNDPAVRPTLRGRMYGARIRMDGEERAR
jgi:phospholipid/cholesterol/gamma-HCH transport system ATP-binding protein